MSRSPIPKVLSTFRRNKVRALLMGGQACILYGAAEFSRDIDFAVAFAPANLARLRAALAELEAEPIFFPPLSSAALRRGHACHFRCLAAGLNRLRIDIMSRMRGVESFDRLWRRREEVALLGVGRIALMSLADLVRAKKTQRDKHWPMIRRLVEADVARVSAEPGRSRVEFWLREARSYDLLRLLVQRYPDAARSLASRRPALRAAIQGELEKTEDCLSREERRERALDRRYWNPLRAELEQWRLGRRKRD